MIKKFIIGAAAAGLLVAGAASASQLGGIQDTTMANSQISVSGADLKDVEINHTYIGGGQGNGEKTAIVSTITFELDRADVIVQGRLLQAVNGGNDYAKDVDGKKGGYLADSAAAKFEGKATDADGKVTFDLTWQNIPLENIDAIDLVVTD